MHNCVFQSYKKRICLMYFLMIACVTNLRRVLLNRKFIISYFLEHVYAYIIMIVLVIMLQVVLLYNTVKILMYIEQPNTLPPACITGAQGPRVFLVCTAIAGSSVSTRCCPPSDRSTVRHGGCCREPRLIAVLSGTGLSGKGVSLY